MIKRSLFAIGLLASSAAIAANSNFYYIGGNLGQARTSFDSNPAVVGGLATTYDSSASAWSVFGGYQLDKYFGAELRYFRFGDINVQVGGLFTNIQINGWGASLVGAKPLGKDFSLLGRIGGTYIRETRGNCNICELQVSTSSDNTWSPSFGVGLQYDFNARLSARGEGERFTKIGNSHNTFGGKATLWTVGVTYKF